MKYINSKKFQGVSWREHATRRYGNKPDRYYRIRYTKKDGSQHVEAVGWASEVNMSEEDVYVLRSELKQGYKSNSGPSSIAEKKLIEVEKEAAAEEDKIEEHTLNFMFDNHYIKDLERDRKPSVRHIKSLYKTWVRNSLGNERMKDITTIEVKKLKAHMEKQGRATSTALYVVWIIGAVYFFAKNYNLYKGENPVEGRKIKKSGLQNARERYLSHQEIELLLSNLQERCPLAHDMSIISLYTGFRFKEIKDLKWGYIDKTNMQIMARDTKNKKSRRVPLTPHVLKVLENRDDSNPSNHVFPELHTQIHAPHTFYKVAKKLFNKDVEDRRDKVVFHTLRHTYASHLVQQGVDLTVLMKLMGHSSYDMVLRYAHLAPNAFDKARNILMNM